MVKYDIWWTYTCKGMLVAGVNLKNDQAFCEDIWSVFRWCILLVVMFCLSFVYMCVHSFYFICKFTVLSS